MTRDIITEGQIQKSIEEVILTLNKRLKKKGYGAFAGTHECYGVVVEEVQELAEEMRANDDEKFKEELLDVIVAAIFGLASLKANKKL